MFQQLKNIDTAFKHIRLFSLLFLLANVVICSVVVYSTSQSTTRSQQRVYLLANGKLLDAVAVDRADSLQIEIADHVKMFHYYFYSLEPDEQVIRRHVTQALYLAGSNAAQEYANLTESGYYTNVIAGNVSQQVMDPDSIVVDINKVPYAFRYYGRLRIVRSTSIVTRSLVTEGNIRVTQISSHNPHGFLIEGWKVLANNDLTIQKR